MLELLVKGCTAATTAAAITFDTRHAKTTLIAKDFVVSDFFIILTDKTYVIVNVKHLTTIGEILVEKFSTSLHIKFVLDYVKIS